MEGLFSHNEIRQKKQELIAKLDELNAKKQKSLKVLIPYLLKMKLK